MDDTRKAKGNGPLRTTCTTCGWPLRRYKSRPPKDRNYCDTKCRDADPVTYKRSKRCDAGVLKSDWIEANCGGCGKTVNRRVSEALRNIYCSRQCANAAHKSSGRPPEHGYSGTKVYDKAKQAIDRCYNPLNKRYADWGGRGIRVYGPWITDPVQFMRWMEENLGECPEGFSLDRIDNNGNYEPGNLRWADAVTQANNKRNTLKGDLP